MHPNNKLAALWEGAMEDRAVNQSQKRQELVNALKHTSTLADEYYNSLTQYSGSAKMQTLSEHIKQLKTSCAIIAAIA